MATNRERTVFIGNLDERVSDRVLYDILIQAGRIVDLYIPRDKESDKPKGYAFAEYESEEIADYAVKLFSGLVTLYNRTLRFAISGQDKASSNVPTTSTSTPSQLKNLRQSMVQSSSLDVSRHSSGLSMSCRLSEYSHQGVRGEPNGYGSHSNGNNYEYSRRIFGSSLESITRTRPRRYDTSNPVSYPPY